MLPNRPFETDQPNLHPNPDYLPPLNLDALKSSSTRQAEPMQVVVVRSQTPELRTLLLWVVVIAIGTSIGCCIGVRFGLQWAVRSAASGAADAYRSPYP